MSAGAIVGIVGGGVAALVIIVLVVAMGVSWGSLRNSGTQTAGSGETSDPAQTARAFLLAVADSDAETALSLVDYAPDDKTLLTGDVLRRSNALAPLTDIQVGTAGQSDGYSVDVPVSYALGGKRVEITMAVNRSIGKDTWKVAHGDISVGAPYGADGLDLLVNGTSAGTTTFHVFPGTYELTTDSPLHTLTGTTTITVWDRDDYSTSFDNVDVALNEAGTEKFRTAVQQAAQACLAATTAQADCGLSMPGTLMDGTQIVDGTVTRTLSAEAAMRLDHLEAEPTSTGALQVRSDEIGRVDVVSECEVDGRRMSGCTFTLSPRLGSALVDLASDPPVVRWE